jgi:hypothetical protein
MDPNLAGYVVGYYGHFLSEQEHLALRHLMVTQKATHGGSDQSAQEEAKSSKTLSGLLSQDPTVLELARNGREAFIERAASRILAEHGDKIFLNYCPRCGALAKTPKARQCRFCRHDWHGSPTST